MYLSIFRVFLSLEIIYKIIGWASYSDFIFGNRSFILKENDPTLSKLGLNISLLSSNYKLILILLMLMAFLSLFGIFKNFSIFALFLFLELIQRLNPLILNGGDNLLKFLVLYLSFADSFKHFTFFKQKESGKNHILSNLSVLSTKLHLCLVYFISGISKTNSKVWFSGVALYYCLSLDRFQGTLINKHIIQNGWIVTVCTYLVMLWEVFFPFLATNKRFRTITLLFGICTHIGIFLFMMIYDFEVIFIRPYLS